MKNRKRNKNYWRKFLNRNRAQLISYGGRGIILIIAAVIVVIMIQKWNQNKEIKSEKTVKETVENTVSESAQQTETQSVVSENVAVVAADVAEMDDADDPQDPEYTAGESGTGASVNMTTALSSGNQFETSGITYGIDVAKYQGTIDWAQVAASGVEYAMIRVGYRTEKTGIIYEDPCAKYNLQQAQAAGLKIGAYFYSTAVSKEEAKEEAAWVSAYIAQYKITYPVAFNCEGFKSESSRQYNLTNAQRTDNAIAFLDDIKAQGYTPMFYAAKNEMAGNTDWDMDRLGSNYKIWVSQYPDAPYPETAKSSYQGTHAMWQYTSQGQVPGISKKVDVNVAYFGYSVQAEAKDATPVELVAANPEVGIIFTEVNETITAKSETNLRTVPSSSKAETIVVKIKNGETATRTGLGNNGWSRVVYNGQNLYAVSSYLTTSLGDQTASTDTTQVAATTEDTTQATTQATTADTSTVPAPAAVAQGDGYKTVSETVTAKSETNLRTAPNKDVSDNIVKKLTFGESIIRTGINDNGWSRLEYNGAVVYAMSTYLTTDLNYQASKVPTVEKPESATKFTEVNQQVTPKSETNLRSVPNTSSADTIVVTLHYNDMMTRTGIGENGWSRVVYNGQTLYAVSSYLVVIE